MRPVTMFFLRSGKFLRFEISDETFTRFQNALGHFQNADPAVLIQSILLQICIERQVPEGEGPREEDVLAWLQKQGF
jgi:hypothetical protein